jgi:phosphatidylglycerol:prolipoprotein diacylglycerol transferase
MGMIFAIFLITAGLERLLVEFIRLNPLYLGLSQAQWISIGMIVAGVVLYATVRNRPPDEIVERPRGARARSVAARAGASR